jgi:hypothetical protein
LGFPSITGQLKRPKDIVSQTAYEIIHRIDCISYS